ncbi:hypothetical protein JCM11491_002275 [Sporobolomyces phaffii]
MDAATLGSTISTTSGLALVNSVRHSTAPRSTLVDGLDALLHGAATGLHRGDVVEVQGVTASGKTHLLTKLAVNHVLPRRVHVRLGRDVVPVPVGGHEHVVVWLDCTAAKFDVARLATLVRGHLVRAITEYRRPKGIGPPTEPELDSLVDECLARLHVFSPTSTLQLACTIQTLPEWYDKMAATRGGGGAEELGLVVVDGMTEFAWADQYEREHEPGPAPVRPPLQYFSSAIAHMRETLSPLIFISQWVLRPSHPHSTPSQQDLPSYRPHFQPPLYPSLANPPASGRTSRDGDSSPLGPVYYPSSPDSRVFPVHFHITLHPSPRPVFRKGVSMSMVLKEGRRFPQRTDDGDATRGIVCVLRQAGGQEIGSWDMEIGDTEIIA